MTRLLNLEALIGKAQGGFYKIGKALKEIRDDRLYRVLLFECFEAYLKQRWDMSRSHAYRLIEAARIIDNLSPIGDILPENEAQLRPLMPLKPADQRTIWRAFLSSGAELKTGNIRRFVLKHMGGEKQVIDRTDIISVDYKHAVTVMLKEIATAREEGWRSTSREAGLFWLGVMRDKILSKG